MKKKVKENGKDCQYDSSAGRWVGKGKSSDDTDPDTPADEDICPE